MGYGGENGDKESNTVVVWIRVLAVKKVSFWIY